MAIAADYDAFAFLLAWPSSPVPMNGGWQSADPGPGED
jgi:hypothetical protein